MATKEPAVASKRISFNQTAKITDKLSLKPKAKEYFIHDTEISGFWVKVMPNGNASYLVNAKPHGSRKDMRRTIGSTKLYKAAKARSIAREWIHQIKHGIDPKAEVKRLHAQTQTLEQAFNDYIEMKVSAGKLGDVSVRNYRASMRNALKPLMKMQINTLTGDVVFSWYKKAANHSAAQAERARRELNAVCNLLVVAGNLEKNPVQIIKATGQKRNVKPKTSSLTTEDVGKVIVELPTFKKIRTSSVTQGNLWLFSLLTGLREASLYRMKWEQVKFKEEVVFKTTKNSESYILPLIPLLNDILEEQRGVVDASPNPKCEYVFPSFTFSGPIVDPRKSLTRLYEMAGINKAFRDHDMRRTFASIADLAMVSHTDIKHLMVHKKKDITEQYMQSQQVKARKNYQAIAELVASETKISYTTDETGRAITHLATVDILRFLLFGTGRLASHPDRFDGDFLLGVSEEFYQDELNKQMDW